MNADPKSFPGQPLSTVHWNHFFVMAYRRIGLFAACFGAVLLLTIVYLIEAPRLYQSTAAVQVEEVEQQIFKTPDGGAPSEDLKNDDVVKTIEQNLQNYTLFADVASDPAIASDPDFLVGYPSKDRPVPVSDVAKWLKSNTTVGLRHGTRLIDVSVYHRVPAMAQKLVGALIRAFFVENARTQSSTEQTAVQYLVSQSEQTKATLQQSENSLQIYKDALLLKDRIEDQQRVLDALRQRYREKHPQLIQARALLADLMQSFDQEFQKVLSSSTGESSYWAANGNELSTATPADRVSTELKLVEARSNVLQMEVDTESALFDNILKQMREANVSQNATPTVIQLIEPPDLPVKPAKPKKTLTLAMGLVLGTLLGAAAIFGANAIDSTVKTVIEVEELLGIPVLGAIPLFVPEKTLPPPGSPPEPDPRKPDDEPSPGGLIVRTDPASGTAEGFRSLRAAISLLGKSKDHRSVLFTSALPDEGKTFVSTNYSLALAQIGLNTLLIDIDLRRPSIHRAFDLPNRKGFVEIVTQGLELPDAVHRGVAPHLDVLTAGGRCSNPAELLSGSGFQEVLAAALKTYDRVIVDSSPINLVSDSLLIASSIQSVCLVVRAASTSRRDAQHALTLLHRADIKPAGVVLNALPPWSERLYPNYLGEKSYKYRQSYSYAPAEAPLANPASATPLEPPIGKPTRAAAKVNPPAPDPLSSAPGERA
jgi:capsular exopolysaccharide synthesis family protein